MIKINVWYIKIIYLKDFSRIIKLNLILITNNKLLKEYLDKAYKLLKL